MSERTILHLDLDAFYASVEELDHPEYRGQPLIVGGLGPRGVVSTASYAARSYGVRSAMPTAQARRLCPDGIYVWPRHARYREASAQVFAILRRVSPLVEPLSLDEAFVDASASLRAMGPALAIAQRLQQQIRTETALSGSIGIAPNKLVAKLASEAAKPGGIRAIEAGAIRAFLDPLPLGSMWGVGKVMLAKLQALGLERVADLLAFGEQRLASVLGGFGHELYRRCLGADERPVLAERPDLSISAEETFDVDLRTLDTARSALMQMCERAAQRLRERRLVAGTVVLKLRRPDFSLLTRQTRVRPPADHTTLLYQLAVGLLERWWNEVRKPAVRLLGIGFTDLAPPPPADLFGAAAATTGNPLDRLADAIAERYGHDAIGHGRALGTKKPGPAT